MLALVADRHFFVRAVSLGPQGIRRARFGPPPPPQPRRAPSSDPPPHPHPTLADARYAADPGSGDIPSLYRACYPAGVA